MTGNKKVSCKVCYREMRSDNLTRHMKQHSSVQQTTEEICKDIVSEQVDKVVDMQSAPWTKRKFENNDSNEDLVVENGLFPWDFYFLHLSDFCVFVYAN